MTTRIKKKKTCYCKWQIDEVVDKIAALQQKLDYLIKLSITNRLTIYSADNDVAVGRNDSRWHKVVCVYDGDKCLGGPRPHWQSTWSIDEKGFHLESFVDENWKGWHGQYTKSELRYDQIPQPLLALHHNVIVDHIERLGVYYPCHIYNEFSGEMSRP